MENTQEPYKYHSKMYNGKDILLLEDLYYNILKPYYVSMIRGIKPNDPKTFLLVMCNFYMVGLSQKL
jgi:hypothetical protein